MFRTGMPTPDDIRVGPGVFWSKGAMGKLDPDVAQALLRAYARLSSGYLYPAPPIILTQGAHYEPTPGMAHDGGGVADLRVRHLTHGERAALIHVLEDEGFGVYDLGPPDSGPHLHIILSHSPNLNEAARDQLARLSSRNSPA